MSGIAGFCDFTEDLTVRAEEHRHILIKMREALHKRGGLNNGEWLSPHIGFAVTSSNPRNIAIPFTQSLNGNECGVMLDGEIYNRAELWAEINAGSNKRNPEASSDAALLLFGFHQYGIAFINRINGVFAAAVWHNGALYLFRDHAGIKPLFYTRCGNRLVFASEIKGLFAYPKIDAILNREGLAELFILGPAREEHSGVFKDIHSIPPGSFMMVKDDLERQLCYWDFSRRQPIESEAETVARVRKLLLDAINRQTEVSDNVCAFLSGGVDSSVVTAVAAEKYKQEGRTLKTFSFDFKDSAKHFAANDFQPDRDRPWVEAMVKYSGTEHCFMECGPEDLNALLGEAVIARDLPGMADIDASLLYFCSRLPKGMTALTGECADEVFAGYPWFNRPELLYARNFPWSADRTARKTLLSEAFLQSLDFDERAEAFFNRERERASIIAETDGTEDDRRLREVSFLTVKWFMTTLTDRMDRMGAYAGIDARVPFADKPLMDYVWNVPWPLKQKNGVVKYLLRESMRGVVPDEVLFRKKSPFPKTYDPVYLRLVAERVEEEVLNDPNAPVRDFIDIDQVRAFLRAPVNLSKPWFGQLMAGPQRLVYLWQINFWLRHYHVLVTV